MIPRKFWVQKYVGSKSTLGPESIYSIHSFITHILGQKKIFQTNFGTEKVVKKIGNKKTLCFQKQFVSKNILSPKYILSPENIWSKKIFDHTNLHLKFGEDLFSGS